MEKDEIDLNFEKKLNDVSESVKQTIQENNKKLIETRYYKEFVLNTKQGQLVLNDVFITLERNKEGDMEYHFRWAKENEQGEMTIEEKMMADKDGNVYSIEALRGYFESTTLDMDTVLSKNDKERGRLRAISEEQEENKKGKKEEETKEPQNEEQEEKKAKEDLKKDDKDIEISKFRKIKDNHLQERMPNVFDNNSEYAIAYSTTLGSFVVLEAKEGIDENGKLSKQWKVNENVQTAGANYRSIISISENGDKVERKVPYALLRTNRADKEIAITLEAQNYGELDIETVDVMPCQERVSRQVRTQGDGIEKQETLETRREFEKSGTQDGVNKKAHEIAHGFESAEEDQKEDGEAVDPSVIDANTPIPDSDMTWGELSEETGENILKLVERYNREKAEIQEKGEKPESENIIQIIINDYKAISHEHRRN
ncbi:MAG: hypothetical protein BHV99_00400 [Clostridium sp. 26_21]|nr:MAG: hypothetical protein BHV99_00400 [Clostridium sp. 26_21]